MKKKKTTVNCGDWMLGWGYIGYDKIGKLTILTEKSADGFACFSWKGYSQGRHGGTWNHGAKCEFESDGKEIRNASSKGSYPVKSMLLQGVNELLQQG